MVMYRDFAARRARSSDLVGEVENKADGTVFVVAEGEEEKLKAYIEELKKGPLLAHVNHVDVTWGMPGGEFKDFTLLY